jgi:hypothetical protein
MYRTRNQLAVLLVVAIALLSAVATAQRRRRDPPPPPPIDMATAVVTWTLFVSAYGETPAHRSAIEGPSAGPIPVPMAEWSCEYGAASRARLNDTTWSEVRTIECTHGTDVVSTSGFCQVIGPSWGARAGTLSIGSTTAASRLNITVDCEVH